MQRAVYGNHGVVVILYHCNLTVVLFDSIIAWTTGTCLLAGFTMCVGTNLITIHKKTVTCSGLFHNYAVTIVIILCSGIWDFIKIYASLHPELLS